MLNEVCKYHDEWLKIAFTFLQNKQDAEDLIQDFYLRLHRYNVELNNVRYKKGINKMFFYKIIRNMALDFLKAKKPCINLTEIEKKESVKTSQEKALDILFLKVEKEMNTWGQYDRILFECYMYSGLSYRQIAYGTDKIPRLISKHKFLGHRAAKIGNNISVSSMFNTIKICRIKLKKALDKDFEHYFNNQFDKII